jgi:hypothetical protein
VNESYISKEFALPKVRLRACGESWLWQKRLEITRTNKMTGYFTGDISYSQALAAVS